MRLALLGGSSPVFVFSERQHQFGGSRVEQGLTHTGVTPLDLVKCRRQVDPKMYKGNFEAWGKIGRAEGFRGIFTGWSPTFFGYSVCSSLVVQRWISSSDAGARSVQVRRIRVLQEILLRSRRREKCLQV